MATQQTAKMEDYLKRIALLCDGGNTVKVTEISQALGVKKSSVSWALKKLSGQGLVEHKKYGRAALTAEGNRIAQDVIRRHKVLRHFLVEILNVDPVIAAEDACQMEHLLSPASLERLAKFEEFVLNCPQGEPEWLKGFNYYFNHGERDEKLSARCQREDNGKD